MTYLLFVLSRPFVIVAFVAAILFSVISAVLGVLQYGARQIACECYRASLFLDGKGRGFVHMTGEPRNGK